MPNPIVDPETRERAQKLANATRSPQGIFEHVGSFGREGGDVVATHQFMVRSFALSDPPEWWALRECIDPVMPAGDEQEVTRRQIDRCRKIYHRAAALKVPPDMTAEYMARSAYPSVLQFIESLLSRLEDQE